MAAQHRSNYDFPLLNLAAYLTLVTVAYPILYALPPGRSRWGAAILFVLFGVLLTFYSRAEYHPLRMHGYLLVQTLLLLAIFAIHPSLTLNLTVLFFVLSAQATLFLPIRVALLWLLLFWLLVLLCGVLVRGWGGIIEMLAAGGGFAFFGAFGAALRQANEARQESQQLLSALQQAHTQLQEYGLQAQHLAVVEERNRLAREMHDALGHRLTVAVVHLEGAQRLIPSDPERAGRMVGTMREQLREALAELRQTVATLRGPTEEEEGIPPLLETLVALTRTFQEATALHIHLALPTTLPPLPPTYQLALYRAAQEGLTNVQRHARASEIWLALRVEEEHLLLTVADNGEGLPHELTDGRFGVRGLRERASALGGRVHWAARPSGGTELHFQIPLREAKDE